MGGIVLNFEFLSRNINLLFILFCDVLFMVFFLVYFDV